MVQELLNVEQFCSTKSKLKHLGLFGHVRSIVGKAFKD
jgi:hypothetical protein